MILIAIGANLPGPNGAPPLQMCERAAQRVARQLEWRGATRSRWYSSAPVPSSDQPRYINGISRLEGKIAPDQLLAALQSLERSFGRVRGATNAARTLDLDIIDLNGLVRDAPDPILPHPRAHLRAFVLLPLRDVAPEWLHPRTGETVRTLLAALPPGDLDPASIRPQTRSDRCM